MCAHYYSLPQGLEQQPDLLQLLPQPLGAAVAQGSGEEPHDAGQRPGRHAIRDAHVSEVHQIVSKRLKNKLFFVRGS